MDIKDDFVNLSVPDAIWLTLDERNSSHLPESPIIVGSTDDGGYYAIDRSQNTDANESPVVDWWAGMAKQSTVASDFGEFFLRRIREALRKC